MKIDEIQLQLSEAWHEIGHARAFIGQSRFLAAWSAVDSARTLIQQVHDALDRIQD